MNVSHRQRHEVGRFPNGKSHLFFVFVFYLNSRSNLNDKHFDKKDTFADLGKSAQKERFVFMWDYSPPFDRNPNTSILCITQKTIKNESTTANPKMTFFSMSRKWSNHAEANNVKKPQL